MFLFTCCGVEFLTTLPAEWPDAMVGSNHSWGVGSVNALFFFCDTVSHCA